jgi:glyoxylase-like metal-dependent hydrolase (beta-lactamase superfamily II)/rhodanese-related sulfurtransferase
MRRADHELITPIVDEGLGNSSYLVDLGDGRALALDPSRHPGPYLELAERRGLAVAFTVETHLHADFVSGSRELADLGALVVAPAAAHLEFPAQRLGDGDEVELGGLTLRGLATPGHTPEHLSYLLLDGAEPRALFSGGSLLVGAVARTDLIDPDRTEDLARQLWRSLHDRILSLPDDLPVYPTHGAGSFCSAPAGGDRVTTIGRERRTNPLLAAPDEDTFVARLLGGLGSYPPYFLRLREVNRRGPTLYGREPVTLPALSVARVRELLDDGAVVVDARPVHRFAAGHLPGSVSIAQRDAFATWLGWLVPDDVPLVFVVDPDQDVDHLVREARKVGYERLAGTLAGGVDAWVATGDELEQVALAEAARAEGTIVDVRQDSEYGVSHVPGAVHAELGAIAAGADVPAGPVSVMCAHGERAMSAASLLAARGQKDVTVLIGGPDEWAAAHRSALATR